jgi:hypothetical protein
LGLTQEEKQRLLSNPLHAEGQPLLNSLKDYNFILHFSNLNKSNPKKATVNERTSPDKDL